MRIGIELNGVLRNTLGKIEQTYQKFMIDRTEGIEEDDDFEYKISQPVNTLDLKNHFTFRDEEELYTFLYEEFPMEIFGHSQSTEYSSFNDLNEIYRGLRDYDDFIIISDEIGKSKPASLFFLSKFGCEFEKVVFYSNSTIDSMWNEIDVLLTANPALLLNHPSNKTLIKYNTEYNQEIKSDFEINTIKELEEVLKELKIC
jgi:FMN phosphatase YigB (HAD superfamily)